MGNIKTGAGILCFALALASAPALAQDPDSLAAERERQNQVSGASSVQVLARLLEEALQQTTFDPLRQHLADKQVYDKMLQLGSASVREALLLYTPTDMLMDFQKDFGNVIRDGITQEVNWPATRLQKITADTVAEQNAIIIPVRLQLSSPSYLPVEVEFNAARLDGRYYYLPPLRIPSKDLD
ncbi:hypothetical protein [Pontibacter mangrovi]|uniref:DUF3887 domain-containing protein n=1 Tax=Pontibacter mangrovi TaxID=2589816 RepID=A0A501W6L5_9BACT|nr:hypothetical protein [Pontibacter mangrovi]TPE43744.1 hypothetical protein FJM65_13460 [Pontibacter mangrovi]